MKKKDVDYFYCDETLFDYGMKDDFEIVVELSAKNFMIKSYVRGWLRNKYKERFCCYAEAAIFCALRGLNLKSKKDDFILIFKEHEYTHEKYPRYFLVDNKSNSDTIEI